MTKLSLTKWLMPLVSLLLFFGGTEIFLYAIDFEPVMNLQGSDIPFWARNAPSALKGLKMIVRTNKKLSNDAYAYEEDLHLFYRLKSNLKTTVSFYDLSGMKLEGTFPSWTIVTDKNGHRVAGKQLSHFRAEEGMDFKRIVFMGGSSIFGWGIDYENTCASQLELLIKDQYPDGYFRFINYAVPGYAMSQHLRILNGLIEQRRVPDLIVLDATSNCDVPCAVPDKEREHIRLKPQNRLRFFLGRFRFFQFLEMLIQNLSPDDILKPGGVSREPMPDYVGYLEGFIQLVKQEKSKLIMIGICARKDYVEQMISVAKKSNIPYINLYDVVKHYAFDPSKIPFLGREQEMYHSVYRKDNLEKNPSLYLLFPDMCHPNPTGHRALAFSIMEKINQRGLLN